MKPTRRVLALLLMLAALLSLAPAAALADPPQGECREGGEHIWDVYSDSATCTEGGTKIWRCRKCGIWWQEDSPALGHAWNEGVQIGGEELLGPRTMHYYCWRCGETKDEIIPPSASWVLNLFRSGGEEKDGSDLVITLQPKGGILPEGADASHTMTVAAEGGVEPYTYEWRGVDKGVTDYLDGSPVGYAVQSHSRRAAEETNQRRAAFYEQYLNYAREHFGVEDTEGARRGWTELQIREYGDIELSSGEEPSYRAEIGECYYYCVVRDSAGHRAESDRAYVGGPLYIRSQPKDAELTDGKAVLSCTAGGGSGNYTYTWYEGDRDHLLETGSSVTIVRNAGEYFCVVQDGDREAVSATAQVRAEPSPSKEAPFITVQPKSQVLDPKSSNNYSVTLLCRARLRNGKDEQLEYYWQRKGANGWVGVPGGRNAKLTLHGTAAKVSGLYRCLAVNSVGGKWVYTRTVRVQVKMRVTNFRFVGRTLMGRIQGGVPPYRVLVIQHRRDQAKPTVKLFTIKVTPRGYFSKWMDPRKYMYYQMVVLNNGQPQIVNARAYYSVIVTDAQGQMFETKTLGYPG